MAQEREPEKASLISIKMRAAQGGPHERGGRHISGEERIVREGDIEAGITKCWSGRRPTSAARPIS